MEIKIARDFINWKATGNKLRRLRSDNPHLRRYVCSSLKHDSDKCKGDGNCVNCPDEDIDWNISMPELGEVFGVSGDVILNWETKEQPVPVEDLLFYCKIAQVKLEDIIVFQIAKNK